MTAPQQRRFLQSLAASHILWMALSAAAVFLGAAAFLKAPCWSLYFLVALIAWPIWHDQKEYSHFRRRAALAAVMREDSRVRRWFWSSRIGVVRQGLMALFWATVLLAFGALLPPEQWAVVAADVLFLALIMGPVHRILARHVRAGQLGLVARRWPLRVLNLSVLTLGVLILDLFLIGAPDTRGSAWNVLAENAFSEVSATASCSFAGWLAGGIAAVDRVTWHAKEVLIPSLPQKGLKVAAWAILALQAGVFAFAFTRFQLGIVALVEHRRRTLAGTDGDGASSKTFAAMMLVLAVPFMYAAFSLRDFDPAMLAAGARKAVAWANPCLPDAQARTAIATGLSAEVERARAAAKQRAGERINGELDALFGKVEQGVDDYLDWYFSVLGEYERLAALATGRFAGQMSRELEQRLFAGTGFDDRLAQANRVIADDSAAQMSALVTALGGLMNAEVQANPCRIEVIDLSVFGDVDRDWKRVFAAGGIGAAVGVAIANRLLVRKTATVVAGRVASKKTIQLAASLPAKTAAKRGGSILLTAAGGTALCAPLGPFAALCGVGAGVATWLIFDQVFIKIDERLFRAEMRAEILEAVLGQKAELANEMRAMHFAAIDRLALDIRQSVDRAFIPFRDGV